MIALPAQTHRQGTYDRLQSASARRAYLDAHAGGHGLDGSRWIAERVEEVEAILAPRNRENCAGAAKSLTADREGDA